MAIRLSPRNSYRDVIKSPRKQTSMVPAQRLDDSARFPGLAARVGGSLIGFIVAIAFRSSLPPGVSETILTAWGPITGWLCGRRLGLAIAIIAAVSELLLFPPRHASDMAAHIVRWSITSSLVWGSAWVRERLKAEYRCARIDPLTGLPNRRAFIERCAAELNRTQRFHRPITLMMVDADDFKGVNDRQGHLAGDRFLQRIGEALLKAVRQYDLVSRFGGDEFVLLFPETNAGDAQLIAGRLHNALQELGGDAEVPVTFSFGVVTWSEPPVDAEQCLGEVDALMYSAKRAGKGTVRVAVR